MDRLVFGAGPIVLRDKTKGARRDFSRRLADALGIEVVMVVASSYEELALLVSREQAHVAWLPPAVFVRTKRRVALETIASSVRKGGGLFRGVLFVREESRYREVSDLQGARMGWVDRDSCSGYLFPRLALRDRGIDPETCFPSEFLLGSHSAVARSVASGRTDAGATFLDLDAGGNATIAGWTLEFEASRMRSVLVTEPIPADSICVSSSLPEGIRDSLRKFFLSVHEDDESVQTLGLLFGVEKFVECDDANYDVVERALAAIP